MRQYVSFHMGIIMFPPCLTWCVQILSENRSWIIERYGDQMYHGVYSLLSTAATGSILWGYFKHGRGRGPKIWNAGTPSMRAASLLLQTAGLVGMSQMAPKFQIPYGAVKARGTSSNSSSAAADNNVAVPSDSTGGQTDQAAAQGFTFGVRCPFDFSKPNPDDGMQGMQRVSRHYSLWSMGVAGLGLALGTPFAPEVAMFTLPLVFAAVGSTHQDSRFRRGMGGELSPEMEAESSNLPFLALLQGRQSWAKLGQEVKWSNAMAAMALSAFIFIRRPAAARAVAKRVAAADAKTASKAAA